MGRQVTTIIFVVVVVVKSPESRLSQSMMDVAMALDVRDKTRICM
jgi:hypothetical protein